MVLILLYFMCILVLPYMCPHCVRSSSSIYLACPHTTIYLEMCPHNNMYLEMCPHTTIYLACPHTTYTSSISTYYYISRDVSSYYYISRGVSSLCYTSSVAETKRKDKLMRLEYGDRPHLIFLIGYIVV